MLLSEMLDDLEPWHAFIGEEFDDIASFNFHDYDTFCPMNQSLLAKCAQ
jgi:hypothetical protein